MLLMAVIQDEQRREGIDQEFDFIVKKEGYPYRVLGVDNRDLGILE